LSAGAHCDHERRTYNASVIGALLLIGQLSTAPHWPAGARVAVWVDPAHAPAKAAAFVERAMKTWTDASDGRLTLVPVRSRTEAAIRIAFVASDATYGEAAPRLDPGTGLIARADIAINSQVPDDPLDAAIVLYLTALHELGHALGLRHSDTFSAIMYRFRRPDDGSRYFGAYRQKVRSADDVGSPRVTGLDVEDISALRELYRSQTPPPSPSPLTRHYQENERVSYRMTTTNQNRTGTLTYTAIARGVVKRDDAGRFFEEFQWSDIVWNGSPFELPPASREFRQLLSLSPDYTPSLPDFSRIHGRLIGPTADLMNFYSDVWLAIRQPGVRRSGDRVVVNHGQAASWADGTRVLIGENAIDFVIVLGDVGAPGGTLGLTVQHVPPKEPKIKIPADWMRTPVVDVPNNWVQVTKAGEGRYVAAVGKEVFDAQIRLESATGRIVSARLENPVEVFERECSDEVLTKCGDGVRYRILRQVEITEIR